MEVWQIGIKTTAFFSECKKRLYFVTFSMAPYLNRKRLVKEECYEEVNL